MVRPMRRGAPTPVGCRRAVGSARQQIEASSCDDLARAGALFLALLVQPQEEGSPPEAANGARTAASRSPPSPQALPAQEVGSPSSSTPGVARRGQRTVSVLAAAGVRVDVGRRGLRRMDGRDRGAVQRLRSAKRFADGTARRLVMREAVVAAGKRSCDPQARAAVHAAFPNHGSQEQNELEMMADGDPEWDWPPFREAMDKLTEHVRGNLA